MIIARVFRWLLALLTIAFLAAILSGRGSARTVGGFLVCGAVWYGLKWRKARSLDAASPRKPFYREPAG